MHKCYEEMYQNEKAAREENKTDLKMNLWIICLVIVFLILWAFNLADVVKMDKYIVLTASGLLAVINLSMIYHAILCLKKVLNPETAPESPLRCLPEDIQLPIACVATIVLLFLLGCFIFTSQDKIVCDRSQDICYLQNDLTQKIRWKRKISLISKVEHVGMISESFFEQIAVSARNDPDGFCGVMLLAREPWVSALRGKTMADEMNIFLKANKDTLVLKNNCILTSLFCFTAFMFYLVISIQLFLMKRHFYINKQEKK